MTFYYDVKALDGLRLEHALSLRGLARKAGVTPRTVRRLLQGTGTSGCHPATVGKVCRALGVTPADIVREIQRPGRRTPSGVGAR